MGEPAAHTPIAEIVQAGDQGEYALPDGVRFFAGDNIELAKAVADMTGDPITYPCGTIGFIDDGGRTMAFVFYGRDPLASEAELSVFNGGLAWSRGILRSVAAIIQMANIGSLICRTLASDLGHRVILERFGFVPIATYPGNGIIYRLDIRTARARRSWPKRTRLVEGAFQWQH